MTNEGVIDIGWKAYIELVTLSMIFYRGFSFLNTEVKHLKLKGVNSYLRIHIIVQINTPSKDQIGT